MTENESITDKIIDEKVVVTDSLTVKQMKEDLETISPTRKSKTTVDKVFEDSKRWNIN